MCHIIATIVVLGVGAIQLLIAVAEIFFWKHPKIYGRLDKFKFTDEEARKIAPIIANAGLYNAFIGAGLIWATLCVASHPSLQVFFLSCVFIAGIFGAITLKPTTLFFQSLPAAFGLAALLLSIVDQIHS
jgi:putative membrane protein